MLSLAGFRPPQFSEDDAWLPPWLQQCGMEQFDEECIYSDQPSFQQRIEDLRCPQASISNGESFREHGGCNIGHLYLSGTAGSSFSCAQTTDNVVQFHLQLLSDEYSENTSLATEAYETKSQSDCSVQLLRNLAVSVHQKAIDANPVHDSGPFSESPTDGVEIPVHTNELSRHKDNLKSHEAADAVELCIAASEALVIDEVTKSNSCLKYISASAILEASLQVKQARLEVCVDPFSGSIDDVSENDDLSDLDDPTMDSAFEDVGLYYNGLLGNDLTISQVKDTLDSECNGNINFEKSGACVTNNVESNNDSSDHELRPSAENRIHLEMDLATECNHDGTQEKVPDNLVVNLGDEGVSDNNDCSGSIQSQPILKNYVSKETPVVERNCRETDVACSPSTNHRDTALIEKETRPSMIQERFQSRWFGGWTWNKPENEMKSVTTVKHTIPKPFAGETSFFSESADIALDGNSFVEHDVASQLSAPSQNCPSSTNVGIFLSQDVRSSSLSLIDPLCSVVPCSLSENIHPSATINHNDEVFTGLCDVTNEQTKENLLGTSTLGNELASGQGKDLPRASNNESPRVSRKITSLGYYSKGSSIHVETFVEDCHKKRHFLMDSNPTFTSHETPLVIEENVKGADRSFLQKENSFDCPLAVGASTHHHFEPSTSVKESRNLTELPETNMKFQSPENAKRAFLKCKKQEAQQFPTLKRVRFSETNTADKRKLQKIQTTSNNGFPAGAARRLTRSGRHHDSRTQQLNRFIIKKIDTGKKRLILQNMEFVLTGFSCQKEKEIEGLIRKYGGIVLSQIPPVNLKGKRGTRAKSHILPIVLCLKKIQSIKFLYGCAVNALILKVNWLIDSIAAGLVLPSKKYMVLPRNIGRMHTDVYTAVNYECSSLVFNNMGIMLHGKAKSFSNIATIIKHGGGQVFRTLHRLVQSLEAGKILKAVVVADDENHTSRHLKQCALEKDIPMTSVYWIIRSLYAGRLIPLNGKRSFSSYPTIKLHECPDPMQLSQEI